MQEFKFNDLVHKLRTPVETINLLGCGGLKMGQLIETWGPPGGGKSTFCYQTAGYFLEDYPNGSLQIIDVENSRDPIRFKHMFNIDVNDPRVKIEPAATVEDFFRSCSREIENSEKNNRPFLCILDSWTVLGTDKDLEMAEAAIKDDKNELSMYSGGQMLKPRVARYYLNLLMKIMYNRAATVIIINQATTEVTRFGSSITSGGGYGLKHNIQTQFCFEKGKQELTGEGSSAIVDGVKSNFSITKSKFVPMVGDISIFIDTRKGGVIRPDREILNAYAERSMFEKAASGWFRVKGIDKSYRWDEMLTDSNLLRRMRSELLDLFRKQYLLVDLYYSELEKLQMSQQPPLEITDAGTN